MRRKEKEVKSQEAIELILREAPWGTLGLVNTEGQPYLVPLNFVYYKKRLFFHGAAAGEKLAILKANPGASFMVADPLAHIPSYVFNPKNGGDGITLFRSVILYGRISMVGDVDRKAEILQAFLSKYQPEGGYEPVTASSQTYKASVKGVAILELTIERRSGKFSLGQQLNPEGKNAVQEFLESRGSAIDTHTLEAMAFGMGPREEDEGSMR